MRKINKSALLFLSLVSGAGQGVSADTPIATSPSEQLAECVAHLKSGEARYKRELKQCLQKCRLRQNADAALVEQCGEAYNSYRKASGQVQAEITPTEAQSFEIDQMAAVFGVHPSGEIIKFELRGEATELQQRAARVCIFELPPSQWPGDNRRFQAQFNEQIRAIRNQGKKFAYRLSDVSWTEDGSGTRYSCRIGKVDVVGL